MISGIRPGRLAVLLIVGCLLLIAAGLGAEEQIAIHPLRDTPEASGIADGFFRQMLLELENVSDGRFIPYRIDLSRLPPDVPEGGFPPWICPSPSITGGAAFAITGEAGADPDIYGATRIRLYLWRMDGARLLGSDEMVVMDSRDLAGVPAFLDWVISWIDETPEPIVIYVEGEPVILFAEPYIPMHWLYLGLRGGGGFSQWAYDTGGNHPATVHNINMLASANIALQASVRLAQFFAIQAEANLISDFGPAHNPYTGVFAGHFNSLSLQFPLLAKLVLQGERIKAGIFGGVYLHVPLTEFGGEPVLEWFDYWADFPGITAGLNIGWRIGPGNLFIDGRLDFDRLWNRNRTFESEIYNRRAVRINIGYQMGFFGRNSR